MADNMESFGIVIMECHGLSIVMEVTPIAGWLVMGNPIKVDD